MGSLQHRASTAIRRYGDTAWETIDIIANVVHRRDMATRCNVATRCRGVVHHASTYSPKKNQLFPNPHGRADTVHGDDNETDQRQDVADVDGRMTEQRATVDDATLQWGH